MVEVHLMRLEGATAVLARHTTELTKELERRALPRHHASDLSLAIQSVVPHVVRALIASTRHQSKMTMRPSRVNRRYGEGQRSTKVIVSDAVRS